MFQPWRRLRSIAAFSNHSSVKKGRRDFRNDANRWSELMKDLTIARFLEDLP
jgi:hypothetical protein